MSSCPTRPHDIFTELDPRWIQSISCDVHDLCVCLCVDILTLFFPVDFRLLVEERLAYIGKPLDVFRFLPFIRLFVFLRENKNVC